AGTTTAVGTITATAATSATAATIDTAVRPEDTGLRTPRSPAATRFPRAGPEVVSRGREATMPFPAARAAAADGPEAAAVTPAAVTPAAATAAVAGGADPARASRYFLLIDRTST